MAKIDLSRNSQNYYLLPNREIAQQSQEQGAADPIRHVLCFVTLFNLLIN